MVSKVLNLIEKYKMIESKDKVIVALSGGADSVTLLHILFQLQKIKSFDLQAIHINHQIRGKEAQRDENFASDFCKSLGINLIKKSVCIPKLSKKLKIGLEECGRIARYNIFEELSKIDPKIKIATAHTLSDNVETLLMRIASGTSLKGMCGIPYLRNNIIRPLIESTRTDIENYCLINNLKYVNDSTNFEKDYTRNKIRLDIIPYFKNLNPKFELSIKKLINNLKDDEEYLNFQSKTALKNNNIDKIILLPDSIKKRCLIKILKSFTNARVEEKHILNLESIIKNKKGKTYIPEGKVLKYYMGNLILEKNQEKAKNLWQYDIKKDIKIDEINLNVSFEIISYKEYIENIKNYEKIAIDFDKFPKGSLLRNRRSKDIFTFKNRGISKTIKKIFNEMKIPIDQRENIPMIANENNIIWINKIGVSKKYAPSKKTSRVIIIKLKKET